MSSMKKTTMNGYLFKMGGLRRNWKRRWFELSEIGFIYQDKHNGKVLGDVGLVAQQSSIAWHVDSKKDRYHFSVQQPGSGRTYHMYATEKKDFDKWLNVFKAIGCSVVERESSLEDTEVRLQPGGVDSDDDGGEEFILSSTTPWEPAAEAKVRSGSFGSGGSKSRSSSVGSKKPWSRFRSKTASSKRDSGGDTDGSSLVDRNTLTPPRPVANMSIGKGSPSGIRKLTMRMHSKEKDLTPRPIDVIGQRDFDSFVDYHQYLCPAFWSGNMNSGKQTRNSQNKSMSGRRGSSLSIQTSASQVSVKTSTISMLRTRAKSITSRDKHGTKPDPIADAANSAMAARPMDNAKFLDELSKAPPASSMLSRDSTSP